MDTMWQTVMDSIAVPAITAIGALVLLILKNFTDKISKSIIAKNKADEIEKQFSTKSLLIEQISSIVKSVVGANMQLANELKQSNRDRMLTEEQMEQLQAYAKATIMNSLPANLSDPNDELYKIIGGSSNLSSMIDSMIEQYVYEYKVGMRGC